MSDYILTQDISSGRVHKRFPAESGYATHEADNLDDAGAYRILTGAEWRAFLDDPDRWKLGCQRCFQPHELDLPTMDTVDDDPSVGQVDPT